jgi:hypothetical protein
MVTRDEMLGLRRILKLVANRILTLVVLADGDGADLLGNIALVFACR